MSTQIYSHSDHANTYTWQDLNPIFKLFFKPYFLLDYLYSSSRLFDISYITPQILTIRTELLYVQCNSRYSLNDNEVVQILYFYINNQKELFRKCLMIINFIRRSTFLTVKIIMSILLMKSLNVFIIVISFSRQILSKSIRKWRLFSYFPEREEITESWERKNYG